MKFFAIYSFLFLLFFCVGNGFSRDRAVSSEAQGFLNPTKLTQSDSCSPENLETTIFSKRFSDKDKINICKGMDMFLDHCRKAQANAGYDLSNRMQNIWNTFVETKTLFIPLPENRKDSMFAAASAFPRGFNSERYEAAVYISAESIKSSLFFYIFWHELQHVYDIKNAWETRSRISNYDLEFNGFYLASELAEVYRPKTWDPRDSGYWRDEWKALSPDKKKAFRTQAINDFMNKSPVYTDTRDKSAAVYDFTRRQTKN